MANFYQYGPTGKPEDYRQFFKNEPISLEKVMREIAAQEIRLSYWFASIFFSKRLSEIRNSINGLGALADKTGTVSHELAIIDGKAFKIDRDGKAVPVEAGDKIIFLQVGVMSGEEKINFRVTNNEDLQRQLHAKYGDSGRPVFVQVKGRFNNVTFRGTDTQGQKLKTMPELVGPDSTHGRLFTRQGARAEMAGIFMPEYAAIKRDITIRGGGEDGELLHMHGVTVGQNSIGGHFIGFEANRKADGETDLVTVNAASITRWRVRNWWGDWDNKLLAPKAA